MTARRRILIVRMGAMGDVVHTLPAAASLRRAFPQAELDWLIDPRWAPLLEGNPHVTAIRPIELRGLPVRALTALRARDYDCIVDFQGLLKSAITAWVCRRHGEVLGFTPEFLREKAAGIFYDRSARPDGNHVVELNLSLAHAAGAAEAILEFPLPCGKAPDLGPGDFLAVSPSAGWAAKRWPAESFAQLILRAGRELGLPAVINCGPGEEELGRRVAELSGPSLPRVLSGGIAELVGLARRARVLVAGDTGPLHIAAAVGTPVVALFGPTSPERNGPYSRNGRARVLRPPGAATNYSRSANGQAIAQITVDQVLEAVAGIL